MTIMTLRNSAEVTGLKRALRMGATSVAATSPAAATRAAGSAMQSIQNRNLGSMPDGDVMTMAFVVMMEATVSAQDDLKTILEGMKKYPLQASHHVQIKRVIRQVTRSLQSSRWRPPYG